MNYRVCKELGYDKEMDLIKNEANKRGIVIESAINIVDYMTY